MAKTTHKFTKIIGIAIISTAFLTGCGQTSSKGSTDSQKVVAKYDGGQITEENLYHELKGSPTSRTILANLLIYKAFQHAYGTKVSHAAVEKEYQTYVKKYGDSFDDFLAQNNFTKTTFRRNLRLNLLSAVALKSLKKVSTSNLQTAWKTYRPTITVQHIQTTSEATAKKIVTELDAGKDFADLAAEYSVDTATKDQGGKLKLASTDTAYDSTFKDAAFKLKKGTYTKTPVKVTEGYEIIKLLSDPGKGSFKQHQAELKSDIYANWQRNSGVMSAVVKRVLKDEQVKIEDKDLKSALAAYQDTAS